ncbi:ABC transporter permease [Leucobacter soli]|uniref:ABC transporter permease n=1 Tax=Leucobacter soli TaxID=2812850 RepID=UPI00361B7171
MNNERPSWQRRAVVLPVVTALVLAFQLAPIVFVVIFSFNEGRSIGSFTTWSVRWYESLFANESLLESLWLSTWVAFVVAVIATFVGTALALALSRLRRAEAAVPGGFSASSSSLQRSHSASRSCCCSRRPVSRFLP